VELRSLRGAERAALLDLLDRWEMPDGWRGRDFFRRYVEDDPTFSHENVLVAAAGGRLLSCVQIFPRTIRVCGASVPLGGIGSVFTAQEVRRRGLAEALLSLAAGRMRARGMEVSLLFATRIAWYTKLGFASWPLARTKLLGPGAPGATRVVSFDPARDLPAVGELHAHYAGGFDGTVLRDGALWQASLRNAGNPGEDFLVVRERGRVVAYGRAAVLSGARALLEWGREPGAAEALADVLVRLAGPQAFGPDLGLDPELTAALERRGLSLSAVVDPTSMLCCLDAPALGRRLGLAPEAGEPPNDFLRRVLPPERFLFWPADRF
jgi:GNAT superfamily N-acetyltransferase